MTKGTVVEAIQLAKARFAQYFPFDIADESWQQLFAAHRTGDILEAVRRSSTTRDQRPEIVYANLLFWIKRLESERTGGDPPMWPPVGVTPKH